MRSEPVKDTETKHGQSPVSFSDQKETYVLCENSDFAENIRNNTTGLKSVIYRVFFSCLWLYSFNPGFVVGL